MESYSNAQYAHTRTSHLTKLYTDAKKSALTSLEVVQPNTTQTFTALHRKYRIQKDRLITWGLSWSDDEKGPDGNIDESVARAGLTETVDSVLRNIKEVTDEAERIKAASVPGGGVAKAGAGDSKFVAEVPFDEARYEDLLRDLTTSIDTLYDLSRSRKALARGEHPTFQPAPPPPPAVPTAVGDEKKGGKFELVMKESLGRVPSYASSARTLVNPPAFTRPSLSPYAGLPPRIESSALRLPEEGPPPYESLGVPSTTRLVGLLVRSRVSDGVRNALGSSAMEVPVLVEFANFDPTYRDTGVPPPLQRLESLAATFQPMRSESQSNLSLLGYFEDFRQPRIGLVYDLPYSIQNRLQGTYETVAQKLTPISLLKLVQKANKPQAPNSDVVVPPLEDRFCIALRLVEQLQALHSREVAHGNINSSSVIFTTTETESPTSRHKQMRSPLWAAFDLFSKCSVEGMTRTQNLNIYKHPEDHPQSPGRSIGTDIKFDMYGLALLLLEVGLWTPIGGLYKAKYSLSDFKLRLEKLWIPKLAAKCGSGYMRAVQACVAAADDLDLSQSGPVIESAYELVLRNIRQCCLLDESMSNDKSYPTESFPETAPTGIKRKPLPGDGGMLVRQQSDNLELQRKRSIETNLSGVSSRLSSLPNLPAFVAPEAQLLASPSSMEPGTRQQLMRSRLSRLESIPQAEPEKSQYFANPPSFKEYKQKVVFLQRRWRVHLASRQAAAQPTRPQVDRSVGDDEVADQSTKPKRQEFPQLPLPQSVVDEWHSKTSYQLAKLVEKALKGSPESSSIALTAYGETPETARPTFLVCCTSTAKVRHVLKRHFKFDSSVCDVRVKRDEIRRCRRPKADHPVSFARRSMAFHDGDVWAKAANPDYQPRPICGASIGAYRDDEHLPPVSFGGVILVDGVSYGMSVHHMLEADDDDDEDSDEDEDESDTSSVRSFDNVSISSESEDESTVRPPSTVPDTRSSTDAHEGDAPGIVPGDYEEVPITQPALDDAIELDLHVDEEDDDSDSGIDEDHLLSYKLGQVHASSGLKRTATSLENGFQSIDKSLPQEIDWALFELVPPRIKPYNVVRGGARYCSLKNGCSPDTNPVDIRSSSTLAQAKVHCLGRTSGLASGTISHAMELVKIHGRSTFSASWAVDGNFGVGGDSGAWVISNDDGRVCGHVLASRKGRTYICPMDLLLEDIKATLGAGSVTLPGFGGARAEEDAESQALRDAVKRMRMGEERGGVALRRSEGRPAGREVRRSRVGGGHGHEHGHGEMARGRGVVEAAG
ncbi:V-type proton ATPase 16 kDa proteolipid subunit [Saxophila tyrrhenica]|uniref:V-type proton ATPase 16 kDa proteolipid subunit n=1 Tax=Saxophila tyrrhenica TaxID=1690608 RepID=A0AAV9PBX0_9PEZI|nr:V-type proton ATPase 16 kDa proteolipid subunit [Saxophila tyrrhenica]